MPARAHPRLIQAAVFLSAAGFAAAAVASLVQPARLPGAVASMRTAGLAGQASVFGVLAVLPLVAMTTQVFLLLETGVLVLAFVLGGYVSESPLALLPAAAIVVFVVAFFTLRDKHRAVGNRRLVAIAVSTALGIGAIVMLGFHPRVLTWERVRNFGGRTRSLHTQVLDGDCGTTPRYERASATLDSGCDPLIPARDGVTAATLAALSLAVGAAATTRLPER